MNRYNYSIIIPHKNIPNLLQRCLNSIPEREDVQIIIIDDNSNPKTVDFSDFPGKKRKNTEIFFLKKENGGAGFARNYGLNFAKGKWLLFADADDFFNTCLNEVLDEYKDDAADIVFFKIISIKGNWLNKFIDIFFINPKKGSILLKYLFVVSWAKLIKRSIVINNSIKFDEIQICEDITFSYLSGFYAKSIKADKRELYFWYYRENSLSTQKINPDLLMDKLYVLSKALLFYKNLNQGIKLKKEYAKICDCLQNLFILDKFYLVKAKKILINIGFNRIKAAVIILFSLIKSINAKVKYD